MFSTRTQLRLAGLAALLGGAMFALASIIELLDLVFPDLFQDPEGPAALALYARSLLAPLGELLVAVGLVGLYARQSDSVDVLGLVGFVLAFLGIVLVRANYLAILFAELGLALFGVASLRARIYPRTAAVLLALGALVSEVFDPNIVLGASAALGYVGAAGYAVASAAIAWMGLVLLSEREEEARPPAGPYPNLLRLGGEATVVGAALIILLDLAQLVSFFLPDLGAFSEAVLTGVYAQQLLLVLGEAVVMLGLVALYVRQSQATTPQLRSTQVLGLIGFLVAFVGTYFALNAEEVNWGALLATDLG